MIVSCSKNWLVPVFVTKVAVLLTTVILSISMILDRVRENE